MSEGLKVWPGESLDHWIERTGGGKGKINIGHEEIYVPVTFGSDLSKQQPIINSSGFEQPMETPTLWGTIPKYNEVPANPIAKQESNINQGGKEIPYQAPTLSSLIPRYKGE